MKAAAGAVLLLASTSCSYEIRVTAAFVDGRLAFIRGQDRPSEPPWCLDQLAVGDRQGEIAWAIDQIPHAGPDRCAAGFPLFYGRGPAGAKETVAARPLRPGTLYVVTGYGGGPYLGAFVLTRDGRRLKVENFDPHSPDARSAREAVERSRILSKSAAHPSGS